MISTSDCMPDHMSDSVPDSITESMSSKSTDEISVVQLTPPNNSHSDSNDSNAKSGDCEDDLSQQQPSNEDPSRSVSR